MSFDLASLELVTQEIVDRYRGETPRACAVLTGALLDVLLEQLLTRSMTDGEHSGLFGGNGPLGTFSSKIKLAHAWGLISAHESRELNMIRKIRNHFAHEFKEEPTFETSPVKEWVNSLKIYEGLSAAKPTRPPAPVQSESRWRFELSAGALAIVIESRLSEISPATELKSPIDRWLSGHAAK